MTRLYSKPKTELSICRAEACLLVDSGENSAVISPINADVDPFINEDPFTSSFTIGSGSSGSGGGGVASPDL